MALDFDKQANTVRSSITPVVVKGNHVADLIFSGKLANDPMQAALLRTCIETVVNTEKPAKVNLGMVSYYAKQGDVLSLRFIDPKDPKMSETMATLTIKDHKIFSDEIIQKLMKSFVLDDAKPKMGKKPKGAHPA